VFALALLREHIGKGELGAVLVTLSRGVLLEVLISCPLS